MRAARWLALAPLLAIPEVGAAALDGNPSDYVVLLQDFASTGCESHDCGWLGTPLIDGVLELENKSRRKSLQAQLAVLNTRLPGLDLHALVRDSFCRELSGEDPVVCEHVKVLGAKGDSHVDATAKAVPRKSAAGTVLVRLSIEYSRMMRFNELRIIAALSPVSADGVGKPLLYAWYVTPGGEATQVSPLEPPSPKPSRKQLAADAHWFGSDGLMDTEIRRAVPELARILRQARDYLPGAGAPRQWSSLRTLADLQAQGKLKCPGASCRFPVLGEAGERVWFVQQADAPVIVSVPTSMWK